MLTDQEKHILSLSDKMHESKKDLLNFIEWYHGDYSEEYWQTDFLVQTQSDLHKWMDFFEGNPDDIHTYNFNFRRWKIEQNICELDEFKDLLFDKADFIETFFQQRGFDRYVGELKDYLKRNSIGDLYELHCQYPYSRIEYLIN